MANDLITVTQAELVTVMGAVHKPGRFTLEDRKGLSLIEALARAEGPVATASLKSATILRPLPGSKRVEIKVNLQDVLKGKAQDTMLQPDDILVVPDSYAKGAFRRTLETALQVATGMAIYR
jgi:protein involved in polysaccharide export with SLBB domain